jgi:DNA-binding IclR family transcriptional regulator
MQQRSERTTQTLERGLELLLAFSEARPTLTAGQLAERSGLPQSTVYRLLQTLEARGFVSLAGGGRYQLGLSILGMLRVVRRQIDQGIAGLALPVMEELVELTGETVILTVVSSHVAVCIQSVESDQSLRLSFRRGAINPLWSGASAKVLLAHLDDELQATVIEQAVGQRYASGALIERDDLVAQLAAIQAQGYAVTGDEVDLGVRAVAVPVLMRGRQLLAGLSIAAPRVRLDDALAADLACRLSAAAARISADAETYEIVG